MTFYCIYSIFFFPFAISRAIVGHTLNSVQRQEVLRLMLIMKKSEMIKWVKGDDGDVKTDKDGGSSRKKRRGKLVWTVTWMCVTLKSIEEKRKWDKISCCAWIRVVVGEFMLLYVELLHRGYTLLLLQTLLTPQMNTTLTDYVNESYKWA